MRKHRRFLEHRCRHEQIDGMDRSCAIGHDPEEVARVLTPEQRAEIGHCTPRSMPCVHGLRGGLHCDGYEPWTEDEIAKRERETDERLGALAAGLSPCCRAPLDTSQVIKAGRHKGHGPRFCSACGKLAFMV